MTEMHDVARRQYAAVSAGRPAVPECLIGGVVVGRTCHSTGGDVRMPDLSIASPPRRAVDCRNHQHLGLVRDEHHPRHGVDTSCSSPEDTA